MKIKFEIAHTNKISVTITGEGLGYYFYHDNEEEFDLDVYIKKLEDVASLILRSHACILSSEEE